jgi:hypothetical protein
VRERDGNQCTFVNASGRRCSERAGLEFHHHQPFGRGGDHSTDNVQMICAAHNGYLAEHDYGKDVMERYRRSGSRAREPAPVYSIAGARFRSHSPWEPGLIAMMRSSLQQAQPPTEIQVSWIGSKRI